MDKSEQLLSLADKINNCEHYGAKLSAGWYTFDKPEEQDVEHLFRLSEEMLLALQDLSDILDANLTSTTVNSDERASLQYAYNLVQELIQSRTASKEMMRSILDNGVPGFEEYFRALALKEKAASEQAEQLYRTLRKLQ